MDKKVESLILKTFGYFEELGKGFKSDDELEIFGLICYIMGGIMLNRYDLKKLKEMLKEASTKCLIREELKE